MFIIEAFVIVFLKSAGPPVLTGNIWFGMQIFLLRKPNVGLKNKWAIQALVKLVLHECETVWAL
jgi:hypothetical protein